MTSLYSKPGSETYQKNVFVKQSYFDNLYTLAMYLYCSPGVEDKDN